MAGHMAPFRGKSSSGGGGLRRAGDDAFKLTVDYLKQEALDPLKGLGRFLLWGVAGSFAIAIGVLLALVGILRLLQTETGTALTGNWSWVPYFAVALIGLAVAGLAAWRITAGPGERKLPKHASNGKDKDKGKDGKDKAADLGPTGSKIADAAASAAVASSNKPLSTPAPVTTTLAAPAPPAGNDALSKKEGIS
jgi:hypothetical protein